MSSKVGCDSLSDTNSTGVSSPSEGSAEGRSPTPKPSTSPRSKQETKGERQRVQSPVVEIAATPECESKAANLLLVQTGRCRQFRLG